jgi:hypothetical protein
MCGMWDGISNVARAGLCLSKPRRGTKYRIFSDCYCELNSLGMSAEYAGMRHTSAAAGEIESQLQIFTYPSHPNVRYNQCAQNKRASNWSPERQTRVGQKCEIIFIRHAEVKLSLRVMQAHRCSGGVLRTSIHC